MKLDSNDFTYSSTKLPVSGYKPSRVEYLKPIEVGDQEQVIVEYIKPRDIENSDKLIETFKSLYNTKEELSLSIKEEGRDEVLEDITGLTVYSAHTVLDSFRPFPIIRVLLVGDIND